MVELSVCAGGHNNGHMHSKTTTKSNNKYYNNITHPRQSSLQGKPTEQRKVNRNVSVAYAKIAIKMMQVSCGLLQGGTKCWERVNKYTWKNHKKNTKNNKKTSQCPQTPTVLCFKFLLNLPKQYSDHRCSVAMLSTMRYALFSNENIRFGTKSHPKIVMFLCSYKTT